MRVFGGASLAAALLALALYVCRLNERGTWTKGHHHCEEPSQGHVTSSYRCTRQSISASTMYYVTMTGPGLLSFRQT